MARDATRKVILKEGAKLIHAKGFVNTGLQEILTAARVPKGSFYFYFKSKDDFGGALVDHFCEHVTLWIARYMEDTTVAPLARLERFFDDSCRLYEQAGFSGGCPIGNLSQEVSDLSDSMRSRLSDAYGRMRALIRGCVADAQKKGNISRKQDADELAVFILNGWEGALIDMKVSKSTEPLVIFKKILFEMILTK